MRQDLALLLALFDNASDEAARKAAEQRIWREHGREAAVFVLDLPGFTSSIVELGLVEYLSRANRLLVSTDTIIRDHGGWTVKHEADNCFAAFPEAGDAVKAAGDCMEMLGSHGASASIGIAYGPVLFVGKDDYFGLPVNIASRLGEDIAGAGEILIDEATAARLSDELRASYEHRDLTATGHDIVAMARWIVSAG